MTFQEFGLLLMSIMASTFGQLFLKLGALQLGKVTSANVLTHILSIATTPALLIGLMAYGIGAIGYILLLTRVNLSIAAPSASLMYLTSVLIGAFVFNEDVTSIRLVGLGLIMGGVVLVASR